MFRFKNLIFLVILLVFKRDAVAIGLSTGAVSTSLCAGSTVSVPYTKTGAYTSGNIFTAQLSNATGSFSAPVAIGSVTSTGSGTIAAVVPSLTTGGTGYRIRVIASAPSVTCIDNGTDITITAMQGDTSIYGTTTWNVYCFNAINFTNYAGYYTEDNLSFNTTTRWTSGASPATANTLSGLAFSGCSLNSTNISLSYRRTNFTCGYYSIDIPSHDDDYTLLVNGTIVGQHAGWGDSHYNVWTGWLGTSSRVEIRLAQGSGGSYLSSTFNALTSPLSVPSALTVCPSTTVALTATGMSTYAWTPSTYLSATTGSTVNTTPTANITYSVTGTDATTGCTSMSSISVTASAAFTTAVTPSAVAVCGGGSAILTASGASSYAWSPSTGLSATTGTTVTATPLTTTTYTVTGSNNCSTNSATAIVSVPIDTSIYGNGTWNVYCFNTQNYTSYAGYYTENNLSFNTTARWASGASPGTANAASGQAYTGCSMNATNISLMFRRTGFTCGYYQVDIPSHDDGYYLYINGALMASHVGCCDAHTNVWTGWLSPSTTVDLRLKQGTGGSDLVVTFTPLSAPLTVSTATTVCAATSAVLTATGMSSYGWSPATYLSAATGSPVTCTPSASTTYTVTATDAISGCTVSGIIPVTVSSTFTTSVSPAAVSLCTGSTATLTAAGASSYSWSPSTGLSATTGTTVTANPPVTTTYTVTGSNNCSTTSSNVTVSVPVDTSNYGNGVWNVYCFNSTNYTNYTGYYTESSLSFNTSTRWTSGTPPSNANGTGGQAYIGCTMPSTNWTMRFKRTGFTCGLYKVDVNQHDDDFIMIVNGITVASHTGCCDAHSSIWTGILTASSVVEFKLKQGSGGSYLQVTFTPQAVSSAQRTWNGTTSNDWFTSSNWCGGLPDATTDAVIPAAGIINSPVINGTADCRAITLNAAQAAGTYSAAIAAPSLTLTASSIININGNFTTNGAIIPNSGTLVFTGATTTTITDNIGSSFKNITLNKTDPTTFLRLNSAITLNGTLTLQSGGMDMNGYILYLDNAASSAITRTGSGYLKSEKATSPYSELSWQMGAGTGVYIFPFGLTAAATDYIPVTVNKTTTGTGPGRISIATYPTGPANTPYPTGVSNLYSGVINGNDSANTVNRFWITSATAYTANPTADLTFTSTSAETGSLVSLRAQRWSGTFWDAPVMSPAAQTNPSSNSVTVYGMNNFSQWAVSGNSTPLPVHLVSFNGTCESNATRLHWTTASESNNNFFTLEHSSDARNFKCIAKIHAAGNSSVPVNYAYTDSHPGNELNYYRLSQTDYDGTSELLGLISSTCIDKPESMEILLIPNPCDAYFTMVLNGAGNEPVSMTLYDAYGNIVYQRNDILPDEGHINLRTDFEKQLQQGIYIVKAATGEHTVTAKLAIH